MKLFLLMLIILNPFSQVLYLRELFERMRLREFLRVHLWASGYSFTIFVIFAAFGEPILSDLFQIRLGSLRVFGGLINLYVAYRYVTAGAGSTRLFEGDIADLAPRIALPYMVGPGMLWVSILIGEEYGIAAGSGVIAGVLAANMVFVLAAYGIFRRAEKDRETAFTKLFAMLMRIMALFVGAVGVEMIVGGLQELLAGAAA
jgi:small neutral amino acid transporter SnatA (MarC family)